MANFSTSLFGGTTPMPGRWSSGLKRGGVNAYPVEWVLDEYLPNLGQDLPHPSRAFVVVPRGRVVAAKANTLTNLNGPTTITLGNGVDPLNAPSGLTGTLPVGYAPFQYLRDFSGLPREKPTVANHETIEIPYTVINEAYNTSANGGSRLIVGELVMPYFGSATSTVATPNYRGQYVRYIPMATYLGTPAASSTVTLDAAVFPAFKPKVLLGITSAGALVTSGAAVSYDAGLGKWKAAFPGHTIASVLYEWGAAESQVIGRILGIEPLGTAGGTNATSHDHTGWFKWVTDEFGPWGMPPIMNVTPSTSVTNEEVAISGGSGTLANTPIVPWKAITVTVTGTLVKPDGTSETLTGAELALADGVTFNDYTQGQYFDINFLTGRLTFLNNLTVTKCNVSYHYETDFKDGLLFDRGQIGLTDGTNSGIVGLPAHLDVAGVYGALRIGIGAL